MKYEIDLPDLIGPDGTRYEPTGEFRRTNKGEFYLYCDGLVYFADIPSTGLRHILRPVAPPYEWPAGLRGWGWAMDANGMVFLYTNEPERNVTSWTCIATRGGVIAPLTVELITGHKPPQITDWREPVRNPNWEGNA